ncbi:MAG: MFS transporter, partial [Actinomycetota bacterium]|nr:MFS transporter [Actinomycetota bacterium]
MRLTQAVRRLPRDTVAAAGGAVVFSLSLGVASVALPILALRSGYSATQVGLLTAVSAVTQMLTRLALGRVMRVVADRTLVGGAGLLLAMSSAVVAVSAAVVPFVVAQAVQGVARACFWTGSQTHVVRGPGRAVGALATVNFISSFGLLAGPVLAGFLIERSAQLALAVGAAVALLGAAPSMLLDRLPPFTLPPDRPPGRIWRRSGVDAGCWAGVSAGAWRGLLGSYVPVALEAARQPASTIGLLVSVANGASIAGSAVVGRVSGTWVSRSFLLGTLGAGVGTAAVGFLAGAPLWAGAALALSGLGAGALQVLGPAVATEAVHPEERGEAIAAAGTFRAGALLAAPLAAAGLVAVLPVSAVLALSGAIVAVPAAFSRRLGA